VRGIDPRHAPRSAQKDRGVASRGNEVSLAVRTPRGLAVSVGCPHPGVEKILAWAAKGDSRSYTAIGGFHLVRTSREDIDGTADRFHRMPSSMCNGYRLER
jgi:metal-dependent hydrolase (beta-lactamase superfamily II)